MWGSKEMYKSIGLILINVILLSQLISTSAAQVTSVPEAPYSDRPLGEVYTEEAHGKLRAGLAEADITPTWPVRMLYGADEKTSQFYDRTKAKVMILEASGKQFAIIVYDIIGIDKGTSEYIKRKVENKTGLKDENIIMAGTHNHSYTSTHNDRVRDFITKKTIRAVSRAQKNMFKAKIGIGKLNAREDLNLNRAELHGEANSRLYVVKIEDNNGHLRGIHFNYGSHPTIFTEWGSTQGQIGPEWPGYVRRYIKMRKKLDLLYKRYEQKKEINVEPWVMFSEGAAGDQQPRRTDIHILGEREPSKKVFAEKLAWEVLKLTDRIETTSNVDIRMKSKKIELTKRSGKKYKTLLQSMVINNSVLAGIPGELDVELARMFIRNSSYDNNILVTLADDGIGYIVPEHLAMERVTYQSKGVEFKPHYGEHIIDQSLTLIDPDHKPSKKTDPDKLLGSISGKVEYEGKNTIAIGVKRMPSGPNYAGGFWGRRTVVNEDGSWKIDDLAPGQFYLYVVEADPENPSPDRMKSGYEDIRELVVGYPVTVKANQETRNVNFEITKDFLETNVKSLNVDRKSVQVDGHTLSGDIEVDGDISPGEQIVVGVYPAQLIYRSLTSYLRDPILHTVASQDGEFVFESLPPGRYRIASYIDVNENGIPESVDVTSSPKNSPIISIQSLPKNSFIDDPKIYRKSRAIYDHHHHQH